jgi:hypothetical protein
MYGHSYSDMQLEIIRNKARAVKSVCEAIILATESDPPKVALLGLMSSELQAIAADLTDRIEEGR